MIMEKSARKKKQGYAYDLGLSLVMSLFLFAGAYIFSSGPFYTNDEVLMRSVVNGQYNGSISGHIIFLMAPLSYLMAAFYRLIPQLPWYDIFITLIHFSSVWMIIFSLSVLTKANRLVKGLLMLLYTASFAGIYLSHILYSQFTLIASLPFCAGIVLLIVFNSEKSKAFSYTSILFFMCSALLRKQVFLMGCPLLLLLYIILLIKSPQKKTLFKNIISFIAVIFIAFLTDYFCYASTEWQDYLEYSNNRALSEDYYGFPIYENGKESYEKFGISEVERDILASLNISLVEDYTFEAAEAIAKDGEYFKTLEIKANGLSHYIWAMKYEFVNTFKTQPVGMLVVLSSALLCVLSLLRLDVFGLLIPIGCVLYQLAFSFYFLAKNRFPERISLGLYMLELFMILSYALWSLFDNEKGMLYKKICGERLLKYEKPIRYFKIFASSVIAVCALIIGFFGIKSESCKVKENLEEWDKYIEEERVLSEYCNKNNDNIYFITGSVANWACDRMFNNGYKDSANIIPLCYWTDKSPIFIKKKAVNNLEALSEALLEREDVYLIQREAAGRDWIIEFYSDQGEAVSVTLIDTLQGAQGVNEILKVSAVK